MFLVSFFHIYSLMAHQHLTPSGFESYQVNFHSYLTTNTVWVRARLCKLQKGCTGLAVASDKVYQLLAHGRWFSPGTPASSSCKTGHHNIAEILLKVTLKHPKKKKKSSIILTVRSYSKQLDILTNREISLNVYSFLKSRLIADWWVENVIIDMTLDGM